MTDRELFIKALDALEKMKSHSYLRLDYAEEAIAALRERLAKPEQEPVAWYHAEDYKTHFTTEPTPDLIGKYWKPLYTTPTLRPWVGLTKEEAKEISLANRPYVIDMVAALEARLKEKNGG